MKKKALLSCILLIAGAAREAMAGGTVPYIFNLPTYQTSGTAVLNLDVGHRYLDVNRHTTNINISLSGGVTDWADLFAGYSFKYKDIVGGIKVNILDDYRSDGNSISLSIVAGGGYKDTNEINNTVSLSYADSSDVEARTTLDSGERASGFGQLVIQKHLLSNRVSIGLVPTFAYNTNFYSVHSQYDYSAGGGILVEVYITDRVSICGEAIMNLYGFAFQYMNYNGGFKYSGYRHTFSLWVGNCAGYSPVEYIVGSTETTPKLSFAFTREFDL
jgi:hypothetical protein